MWALYVQLLYVLRLQVARVDNRHHLRTPLGSTTRMPRRSYWVPLLPHGLYMSDTLFQCTGSSPYVFVEETLTGLPRAFDNIQYLLGSGDPRLCPSLLCSCGQASM